MAGRVECPERAGRASRRAAPGPLPRDYGSVVEMPFVYMLRCADGTLYIGHTDDLANVRRHTMKAAERATLRSADLSRLFIQNDTNRWKTRLRASAN